MSAGAMMSQGIRCATNAVQLESAGPGLIAALHRPGASHALEHAEDGRGIRGQLMEGWRPLTRPEYRGPCGCGVLIEGNDGSRLRHDRPPLYAALR
jgi:hypothetical protein